MADETGKGTQDEKGRIKVEEKETALPSLYINNAQFSMTEWDVRIDLGELHSVDAEKRTMFIAPRLRVIMTPEFAQRFLEALHGVLEKRRQVEKEAETEQPQATKEPIK